MLTEASLETALNKAADLLSDDEWENTEYDRAIVELTISLFHLNIDKTDLLTVLRGLKDGKVSA
jgi:hypothetical protein